ncbi:PLC-like phosphodiesterase [Panus rudis PR-1116 ss-1]|nr:PLC-like phosphodiesterase [Panus rudis PR-1116 ss-1]
MVAGLSQLTFLANQALLLAALPAQEHIARSPHTRFYDIQAHRGGRGNTIENTLPSFAWGLIDGATTLELDNGITKAIVVVWHDENITEEKCQDTAPAFPDDPDFPYVGNFVANLTFAQLRTLDCGSKRQLNYPMQLTYPGTRISTMEEVFNFVSCADPSHQILWNIESKINPQFPNQTLGVEDFVQRQHEVFAASPYHSSITYQSFDWRTLIAMKELNPRMIVSALIDDETATMPDNTTTPWLAGLRLDMFPGPSLSEQVAQAARHIGADILSPAAVSSEGTGSDPTMAGYVPFTTRSMVDEAHALGLQVKPWTVNRLSIVEQLIQWHVDGIITDYPNVARRLVKQYNLPAAPKYPKQRVLSCLDEHLRRQQESL